jgi:hypothetical protein
MAIDFCFKLPGEVEFSYLNNGTEHVVTCDIGDDDATAMSYHTFTNLSPLPWGIPAEMELAFCIGEYDPEYDSTHQFWDGEDTRRRLETRRQRVIVLDIICRSVDHLIEQAHPASVMMQTCAPDLPAKALLKYSQILDLFAASGYNVEEMEERGGYKAWLMTRIARSH